MTDENQDDKPAKRDNESKREPELVDDSDEGGSAPSPPRMVREMMALMQFGAGGRAFHPVFEKFEPEHVDKFLDQSHEEDMERLRIRRSGRWFPLIYVVLFLAALGWLVAFLLPQDKDLLIEILKLGAAFLGGLGSGYGIKSYQERRRQD